MSNFPNALDDDSTIPVVNDNINEIGAEAINALRDTVFSIEENIGINAQGSTNSISDRLSIAFYPDGSLKASAITSLGLVTLPIDNTQISLTAEIAESKLDLDHKTQDLYNYIKDLSRDTNLAIGWISTTGIKLEPHIIGALYRHILSAIDVAEDPALYLKNKYHQLRNNYDSYQLISDINNEFLTHQWADGSPFAIPKNVTTFNGSDYPSIYGHTASGIYLNTSRFSTIPQTAVDLQLLAEFLDSSSIFLYGTRIQNLYSNGISKVSRSSSLVVDGYGSALIPPTAAIAYLLNIGANSNPTDDINNGDDIIEFKPAQALIDNNTFDEKFALVKVGDIVRINYGTIEVPFIIKEKKYKQDGGNKKYIIRIVGKNLKYAPNATARIDKSLVNGNKYGVLAVAPVNNNFSGTPSLVVGSPRGAQALGLGFNPDQFDTSHYMLYLALYPTGYPDDGYTILPGIDVTGNKGTTPGKYTLDGIVENTNNAFRKVGYNYRFIAFAYQGEFGIMLADSYHNSAFSILNAVVHTDGTYALLGTNISFPNNVVGIFSSTFALAPDPLGFSSTGSGVASPPYMTSYGSPEAALNPTKLFTPLKRNNYYVNGTEREKMDLEIGQVLDGYGDGYWIGTISVKNIFPGPSPTGRVQVTYRIALDLEESNLKIGKTIVVQSKNNSGLVNFGRFIIQDITFGCAPDVFTDIQVYDAVHATSFSPTTTFDVGTNVSIYFNSDSVSFNDETATDFNNVLTPFKRHFEVYIDQNSKTFTHERGRVNTNGSNILINESVTLFSSSEISKLNIVKISPKLRGFQFGSVTKITLNMINFDDISGKYSGYLAKDNGSGGFLNKGPIVSGVKGEITRFYDETNNDYIDIMFDVNTSVNSFTNQVIDFQLFPTLSLDDEVMMIATCQYDTSAKLLSMFRDERQFGNTSEKEFSTSALNFLSQPERALHGNGVIRGFNLVEAVSESQTNPYGNQIYLSGGTVLVNGKFVQLNRQTVIIPPIKEILGTLYNINWIICVNDKSEYQPIPLLDYDPILGTPNILSRRVHAFNVANGAQYYIEGVTFSNLINTRKDLTPIYIASTQVIPSDPIAGPPTVGIILTDIRKYVNDVDNNIQLKLTSANSQGNFKKAESIFTWLNYNNAFNSSASVKGANEISGVFEKDITLDFAHNVIIDGENDATLTFQESVTFGSNVTIKNTDVVFNGNIIVNPDIQNLMLQNCDITINVPDDQTSNIAFDILNGENIIIENCNITITYSLQYPDTELFRGAAFRFDTVENLKFNNNSLSIQYAIQAGAITPGDAIIIANSDNASITNSNFSGNFNKAIWIDKSNNLDLSNLVITSSYCPNTGTPDYFNNISYASANLVNSGQGYIYSNVTGTLNNIKIDNVTFNYSPVHTNFSKERYSFINFELSNNNSILSNLLITNCKFNNNITGGINEDIRAAVAIINTTNASTITSQQPILLNVNILDNTCNRNQSIILSSNLGANSRMVYPGLSANKAIIRGNVCGTIGYWVSSGSRTINMQPNVNIYTDKTSGLIIENNTCHYIACQDGTGKLFQVSKDVSGSTVNMSDYPSGFVAIKYNNLNWAHVGISFEESSSLHIKNNNFTAYDKAYMDQFNDTDSMINRGHGYAILVLSNRYIDDTSLPTLGEEPSNDSACIISDNIINTGYWLQITSINFTYRYSAGYIYCQSSNIISNNICKGIEETSLGGSATPAILVSGLNNDIHHNRIYRNGKSVSAYIKFISSDLPGYYWDGQHSFGTIADNYLDSPFINDSTLSENVIDVPTNAHFVRNNWIIERNKNQTGYAVIPLTNRAIFNGLFPQWGPDLTDSGAVTFIGLMNDGASLAVGPGSTSTGSYRAQSLVIQDNVVDPDNRMWGFQENIEKYLPNNVRILTIKQGIRPWESSFEYFTNISLIPANQTNSNFFLNLSSLQASSTSTHDLTNTDYFASITSDDTAVFENSVIVPVYSQVTGGQMNSTFSNLPFFINLENYNGTNLSTYYVTGLGRSITLSGDWRWYKNSETVHITMSPIVVKYRW